MSNMAMLRRGASLILLLMLGLICMPVAVRAATEGPSAGAAYPTEQVYSNFQEQGGTNSCASFHPVKVGDTLTKVAAAYGVTIDALAEENGLDDTNLIRLDQLLCIPEATYEKQTYGYAEPGKSYEPRVESTEVEEYGYQPEQYSKQYPEEYNDDPQGSSYAKPGESYEPQAIGYGSENSYDPQGSGYAKPGESYEPAANSGHDEGYSSTYELKPGESAWSSD